MMVNESSCGRRRSSCAKDGSSTKTLTGEEAILDLNQPLSFNAKADSDPIVVKHARLERNVMIRDDRGTVNDRSDDLLIGPLTWVEFDDDKLLINSDSDVLIVDRDTRITGSGMLIKLRPKSESGPPGVHWTGFEGAQSRTARSKCPRRLHRRQQDGILARHGADQERGAEKSRAPGSGRFPANSEERRTQNQASKEPVPLDLRCDGSLQVEFPKPHLPVKEGPPAPPGPTLAHFRTQRGRSPRQAHRAARSTRLRQPRPDLGPGGENGTQAGQGYFNGQPAGQGCRRTREFRPGPGCRGRREQRQRRTEGRVRRPGPSALESHGPRGLAAVASQGRQDFLQ